MDLAQIVNDVSLEKTCSIKPDKDSEESKTVNLRIRFNGVSLQDVFAKAVSSAVIQWQNGPGRTRFDQWANNQTVNVDFKAPGRQPQIAPEVAIVNNAKAMNKSERRAYIDKINFQLKALEENEND